MIRLTDLTKRYGPTTAVDNLDLELRPGQVTGFLGPNGAGKSTTMRLILGLDAPTSGTALIGGTPYARLRHPLRTIGALLDAKAVHPGRTGRDHLRALARSQRIPAARVAEVLEIAGMTSAADRRAGTYSLGMSQRLGIAAALLGDPQALMLDEPVNGLDPDGVRWIRTLLRSLAAEGRTVFVSSHLMSEMEQTADRVVVLGRGRLVADEPMRDLLAAAPTGSLVRGPDLRPLAAAFAGAGYDHGTLVVPGVPPAEVGARAFALGVEIHGLQAAGSSLEDVYLRRTAAVAQFTSAPTTKETGR
ncbi:multidrug ABC transporter ATP-binding protein [Spongiactinospora gelatinilytica]|uniref:Multidrug ABC transporter ATP-binding protein n=1 Tax=Spongiactinospora gelatinilytica TaxID=2666298 RepID=A0A2W2EPX9_9ACTN|nr:ABC transporter ATP-binding protein [Spongiactinospora gelatinilytica]PZG24493.1 multidrug ABC transporter ATP-binding protein [Spongiactinospora gelatinilytica]